MYSAVRPTLKPSTDSSRLWHRNRGLRRFLGPVMLGLRLNYALMTLAACLLLMGCGNLNPGGSVKKRQTRLINGSTAQKAPTVKVDESKLTQDLASAWSLGAFEWQPTSNEQPKVNISCAGKQKCPKELALIQIKTATGFRFCTGTAIGQNRIITHKSCLATEVSTDCSKDITATVSTDDNFTKFSTVKCQKIQSVSAATEATSLEISGNTFERPVENLAIIEMTEGIKTHTSLKRSGFAPKSSYYFWTYQIEENEKSEIVAKVSGQNCTTNILTEYLPAAVDGLNHEMIFSGAACGFKPGSLGAPIFSKEKQEFVGLVGPVILEPKKLFEAQKLKVKEIVYVPSRAQSFRCGDIKAIAAGAVDSACKRDDEALVDSYNRAVNAQKKSSRLDALIAGAKEWLLKAPVHFHYAIKFDNAKVKEEEKINLGPFWMFEPSVACMKSEKISQNGDILMELPYFKVIEGIDEYGKKGAFTEIAGAIKTKFQVNTEAIGGSGVTVVLAENQDLKTLPLDLTGFFGEARYKADYCTEDDLKVSEFSVDTFSGSHQLPIPSK